MPRAVDRHAAFILTIYPMLPHALHWLSVEPGASRKVERMLVDYAKPRLGYAHALDSAMMRWARECLFALCDFMDSFKEFPFTTTELAAIIGSYRAKQRSIDNVPQ